MVPHFTDRENLRLNNMTRNKIKHVSSYIKFVLFSSVAGEQLITPEDREKLPHVSELTI